MYSAIITIDTSSASVIIRLCVEIVVSREIMSVRSKYYASSVKVTNLMYHTKHVSGAHINFQCD